MTTVRVRTVLFYENQLPTPESAQRRGTPAMHYIGMLSGGRNSWAACKRLAAQVGSDSITLLFCDTKEEDKDTYAYLHASAANIGSELVIVADGRSVWEVFHESKMIGNTRADLCSRILKRDVADRWLRENTDPTRTSVVLGYGYEEVERFRRAEKRYAEKGYAAVAPLCDKPFLTKSRNGRNERGYPDTDCTTWDFRTRIAGDSVSRPVIRTFDIC